MKCPKCGFENRPDARFCKKCGQPMQAQAAVPMPPPLPGLVCPACGATAKPEARFCPRCGKPLPTTPSPPTPLPPAPTPLPSTQPQMPPVYTPPPAQPPPPSQPSAYAQIPAAPPPPAAQPPAKRRPPRWLWPVVGIVAFLCIIAVVAAVTLGPKIFGTEKEPSATPTPAESPAVEATPTQAPPTEAPTTEAPTATPLAEPAPTESAPSPPQAPPLAEVSILSSVPELRVGELLTVTVTVTNTGEAPFGNLRCQLLGEWKPSLRKVTPTVVVLPEMAGPGTSKTAIFVLEAVQVGTASLQAAVTMEAPGQPPRPGGAVSESIPVSVVQ